MFDFGFDALSLAAYLVSFVCFIGVFILCRNTVKKRTYKKDVWPEVVIHNGVEYRRVNKLSDQLSEEDGEVDFFTKIEEYRSDVKRDR